MYTGLQTVSKVTQNEMYILNDCYPVLTETRNTSQNQTLLPLLHNAALWGYKNSLIEYMPTCAKK